ncbi:hydantoinase/oxoprolinase N-terminal domain-containing protein [Bradyrhizobium sp. RDT10]
MAIDENGQIESLKSPSRPDDPTAGVMAAIDALARRIGLATKQLLGGCSMLAHGSTIATNTVLEGKGARVGLLTTKGFRYTLEMRRGIREEPWNHRPPSPPVLVPRRWRLPVGGRLDKDGLGACLSSDWSRGCESDSLRGHEQGISPWKIDEVQLRRRACRTMCRRTTFRG